MENSIIRRMRSFRDWFQGYEDNFVIIGGTACSLIMGEEGADFRQTKDIDVVLLVEALDAGFGRRFWDYVLEAKYQHCQKSTGKPQFYRFYSPKSKEYPEMIELFSRRIDGLSLPDNAILTPIPISDDISSLSAILLNDEYYQFLRSGVRKIDGLPVLGEWHIIPFKAKAWLDLTERRNKGESVDSSDIRKHRSDVFKVAGIITNGSKFPLPQTVEHDMCKFLTAAQSTLAQKSPKEREKEVAVVKNLIELYGLPASTLQIKLSLKEQLEWGKRKSAEQTSLPQNPKAHTKGGPEIG